MRSLAAVLPFVVLTVICWGNYGPLMHHGQVVMGDTQGLRPFIGVGFAYFLIAVLAPIGILKTSGEKGHWSVGGTLFSLVAGSVGALGALGVIMAFTFKGQPVYVMPLVFGGAPIVNTIVTIGMSKAFDKVSGKFLLAVVMAAVGAAGVLYFKPGRAAEAAADANIPLVIASIVTAMVCWGSYGPMLHKGQMKLGGSRMRSFLCVGIAYFIIAVALPLAVLPSLEGGYGDWSTTAFKSGFIWSMAGGAAGALGALGIILAFNFGGKPIFVMPLVFGLAPVMNTVTTVTGAGTWDKIDAKFIAALVVTIIGAVCVLLFAPKSSPHAPKGPAPSSSVPSTSTPT